MNDTSLIDRIAPAVAPQIRFRPNPKASVLFWPGLLAAAIPLMLSLYWIAAWLHVPSAGPLLRIGVLGCSILLASMSYRAALTRAEIDLIRVLAVAGFVLLIPTLTATEPSHALSGWIKTITLFTFCWCVTRCLRHPVAAQIFGIALLIGGVILIAFILFAYVRYAGLAIPTYKMAREFKGVEEAAEMSLNSIAFAAVFSYLAGLCLVRRDLFLILLGIPVLVTSSLFTGSRAPLVILAISLFVLLCINGLRSRSLLVCAATALLAISAVCGAAATVVLVSDKDLAGATEGRWHLWSVGLHKFSERPLFGYGYESWRDDLVSRLPGESDLTFDLAKRLGGAYHNQYITVLAEEGLFGAVAAALIVWLLFRSSWLLAFRPWRTVATKQWPLFACLFMLLRANFEVPGLFGYGQEPVDYLAYVFVAIVLSRFSMEEDWASPIRTENRREIAITPQPLAEVRPVHTKSRHRGRILMLSTALGVGGGAEEQVMLLSLGLRARGWDVKIVSLLPLFPLSAALEDSDIQISSLNMKRGIPDPRAIPAFIRELRSFQPDIVHCHMPQANLLARAARPFCAIPVLINTLHNLTMERINGGSGRFLEIAHRWTDDWCDVTTVICTPAVTSYTERRVMPPNKVAVFYNGVDTERFRPDSQARHRLRRELELGAKFAWLAIGRFERAKDYSNMIRAFAKVVARTSQDVVLLICGRGSLEEEIRAQIRECKLTEHVRFLGVRRDIPDVMNAADAFLLSSYLEGLPMVLLQAASVGMPIVATDVGGNSEVVIDGVSGFIVPPHDDEALAGAMERVLGLPDAQRAVMAERGREWAREQFEIEQMLARWEALYTERIEKRIASLRQ